MAVYADEFYEFLEQVQNEPVTVRRIPLTEPRIPINLLTREIEIDKNAAIVGDDAYSDQIGEHHYSEYFAVEGDHRSQIVYFEVDRYFDDVDLMNCTCVIEYINVNNQARLYPVTLKDHESKPGKILFAWSLSSEVTVQDGIITFAVWFYKMNLATKKLIYSLRTQPAKGKIIKTIEYTSTLQEEEQESFYTFKEQAYNTLISMIEQKNVYWNNL